MSSDIFVVHLAPNYCNIMCTTNIHAYVRYQDGKDGKTTLSRATFVLFGTVTVPTRRWDRPTSTPYGLESVLDNTTVYDTSGNHSKSQQTHRHKYVSSGPRLGTNTYTICTRVSFFLFSKTILLFLRLRVGWSCDSLLCVVLCLPI